MKAIKFKNFILKLCASLVLCIVILGTLTSFLFLYLKQIPISTLNFLTFSLILFSLSTILIFFVYDKNVFETHQISEMFSVVLTIAVSFVLTILMGLIVSPYLRPYILLSVLVFSLFKKNISFSCGIYLVFSVLLFDIIYFSPELTANILTYFFIGIFSVYLTSIFFSKKSLRLGYVMSSLKLGVCLFFITFLIVFFMDKAFVAVEISKRAVNALTLAGISFLSPLVAIMLSFILLPMFEYITNSTSNFRLYELCDTTKGLLLKLKEKASGTFNHSLIVANLAEACAIKIGIDPQFTRTAAFFHDIGKIKNPEYFSENQNGYNPHDELSPELSAQIIKSHTINGMEICQSNNIPFEIAEVCVQHHGTLPIAYFYAKAQKLTEGELKIDEFCYLGPKPQSKTAAIIMIVDGCEAAIRASNSKEIDKIEEIVLKIIENRIEFEQFSECELTFKDINDIKDAIVSYYSGAYHNRVKYPKVKMSKSK